MEKADTEGRAPRSRLQRFKEIVAGVCARAASRPLVSISQTRSPLKPTGAEACRYSENSQFIFALSAPFCGHSFVWLR
jgi:hypothetical protein